MTQNFATLERFDFYSKTFDKPLRKYWSKEFQTMKDNKLDTWDFQWAFTIWENNGLAILPNVNMISNIGFGLEATHTKRETHIRIIG